MATLGTFVAGQVLTAAELNQLTNVTYMTRPSGTSVNSGTEYTVPFTSEIVDVSGWHDNSTNTERITPNIAGLYLVLGAFIWPTMAESTVYGIIRKNGNQATLNAFRGTTAPSGHLFTVQEANGTTDYFTLDVYQASGTAQTLGTCEFGAILLRKS